MRLAVLSDTHIPSSCKNIPTALINKIKNVDMVIHAGDLTESEVLDELKRIVPTEAVFGNMDSLALKRVLPEKKILELAGFRIGITHGGGAPDDLINYVSAVFKGEKLHCIIYGHSHKPCIDIINKVIYFNPGSPTERIFTPYNSFGIIEIGKELKPEIIRI